MSANIDKNIKYFVDNAQIIVDSWKKMLEYKDIKITQRIVL